MRALDVKPYRWKIDEIEIVYRRWCEDGESIMFGLDNHGWLIAHCDDDIDVCPFISRYTTPAQLLRFDERDAEKMAERPRDREKKS